MSDYVLDLATANGLPYRILNTEDSFVVKIGDQYFSAGEYRSGDNDSECESIRAILKQSRASKPIMRNEIKWAVGTKIKLSAFSNGYVSAFRHGDGILVAFREDEKVKVQTYSRAEWMALKKGLAHRTRPERFLFLRKFLPRPIAYEIAQSWL